VSLPPRNGRGTKRLGDHFRWWLRGIETGEAAIPGQLWVPDSHSESVPPRPVDRANHNENRVTERTVTPQILTASPIMAIHTRHRPRAKMACSDG
jgi:hypothetical protein